MDFLKFEVFKSIQNAIPNHQKIESNKQSEEATKVRNQGAERVGHHLLLSGDDWTVELYAQYRHIWIRGGYCQRVSNQLKRTTFYFILWVKLNKHCEGSCELLR